MSRHLYALLGAYTLLLSACVTSPSTPAAPGGGRSPLPGTSQGSMRNELTHEPSPYSVTDGGTLEAAQAGAPATFSFSVTRNGAPVRTFEVEHEKLLHLIVVRNDLQEFQHLHPDFDPASAHFTVPITFATNGTYALFVDFKIQSDSATVLPKDVVIGTPTAPTLLVVDDGEQHAGAYTVTPSIVSPIPAGMETMFVFAISKNGRPIADLQNYLGAKGHAVIIKEGSLEYLHTHPSGHGAAHGDTTEALSPGEVHFATTLPSPGRYKVFAQFRPEGNLITTANVYDVTAPPSGVDLNAGHGADHAEDIPTAREIRIETFQYAYAPAEIHVKAGEPVELLLTTRDVAHSFSVEGLDLNATILPGKETRLAFTPERLGWYHFGCDVYCGDGHPTMARKGGMLIVE